MYRCFYRGLSWKIQDEVDKQKHLIKNLTDLQTEASSIDDTLRRRLERPNSFKPQFRAQNERPYYPNKAFPKKNFHQVDKTAITCYKCGKKGHIKSECYSSASNSKPTFWKKSDKTKSKSTYPDTRKKISKISKEEGTTAEINMIEYQVLHPDATEPKQATPLSAGYDLTPCESGSIAPGELKKIPTGLAITIPPHCYGRIEVRSSVAMKGLLTPSHVVNADYTGPIYITLYNFSQKTLSYKAHGDPIAQLIISPFVTDTFLQVDKLKETTRKGGFGSTNKSLGAVSHQPGKCIFAIKIKGRIAKGLQVLIDSGADGNFIGEQHAAELKLPVTNLDRTYNISLVSRQTAKIQQMIKGIEYNIQGHQSKVDLHIVPMDLKTIILSNEWLAKENPAIDWTTKEFTFTKDNKKVVIKPANGKDPKRISTKEFSMILASADEDTQLFQIELDEDDTHMEEFYNQYRTNTSNAKLDKLLEQYDDIFKEKLPRAAPTKRTVVHHIPLEKNAVTG